MEADGAPAFERAPDGRFAAIGFDRLSSDETLVAAWKRLQSAAFLPTQDHAFAEALSHTLLADTPIEVFVIAGAGVVGALLPLCRAPGHFARWRMAGACEVFEPLDALCENPEQARLLADALVRDGRPLWLDRLPAQSLLVPALQAAIRGRGVLSLRPGMPCPTIPLDRSWEDPASRFNAGRRSDFRRSARRAGEFGDVSYEILSPAPASFDALFDEAIHVELCSWKKAAGTAIAADRPKEAFFRSFFRSACERGLFRVAFMRIDGHAVAMQMAIESSQRYWLFKIGYDEKFGKCSPGTLLMLHTLRDAASRGLAAYEMLGAIEPWIAEFWTQEQHDCVRLRTYPFNPRGAAAFVADSAAWLRGRIARRPR